jgi:ribonucleotide monophosphatase NagD (HAD superfamily)
VFEKALAEARKIAPVTNPLVIGDGIGTDILGAQRMGLDALFIGGGIHDAELKADPESLGKLLMAGGTIARAAMPALTW